MQKWLEEANARIQRAKAWAIGIITALIIIPDIMVLHFVSAIVEGALLAVLVAVVIGNRRS